jgi:hypothetical protein
MAKAGDPVWMKNKEGLAKMHRDLGMYIIEAI